MHCHISSRASSIEYSLKDPLVQTTFIVNEFCGINKKTASLNLFFLQMVAEAASKPNAATAALPPAPFCYY
jgi:hypothetical protein